MQNNPWFKDIFKDALGGGLVGIGITMTILISSLRLHSGFHFWPSNLIFGFLVGFLITLGGELVIGVLTSLLPNYLKLMPLKLSITFIISSGIYYGFCNFYQFLLGTQNQSLLAILFTSLGIGISSVMISIFFIYKKNIEELMRLEKENRQLAVLEERNRIARELHDSVSQNLFGISLNLNTLSYLLEHDLNESRKTVHQLQEMVQEVQSEMRLMIYELRPLSLVANSFFEGITSLINLFRSRYHVDINCQLVGNEGNLDSQTQIALYRVLQEALNNTIKHAQASKVTVIIKIIGTKAEMKVQDNGRGFDPVKAKSLRHIGISGMRERIQELGGDFQINSTLGKGTLIKVQV